MASMNSDLISHLGKWTLYSSLERTAEFLFSSTVILGLLHVHVSQMVYIVIVSKKKFIMSLPIPS